MNRSLTIILLFALSVFCQAQNSAVIDSLKKQLSVEISPENKINILLELGSSMNSKNDSVEIFNYYNQALKIAKKEGDVFSEAKIYGEFSVFYYNNYNFKSAIRYIDSAEKLLQKSKNPKAEEARMIALYMKASFIGAQGNAEEQQAYYFKIIPIVEKAKSYNVLNNIYLALGTLYFNKNEYKNAEKYYRKSLETLDLMKASSEKISFTNLKLAMLNLEIDRIQDAENFLEMSKNDVFEGKLSPMSIANFHNYTGRIEMSKNQYDKALQSFEKSLEIAKLYGNIHIISNNLREIGKIHIAQNNHAKALLILEELYETTKKTEDKSLSLSSLRLLADTESKLGNSPKAFHYLRQYVELSDSLKEGEVTQKILQLEKQFETARKEKEIERLQFENERKEWRIQQNNLWIYGFLIALIILIILFFLLFRNFKNQKKINQQEKDLHQFQLSQMEQSHQIKMLSSLMQGAENERQRLGRDLHDGLGGLLSGIKLKLDNLFRNFKNEDQILEKDLKGDLDHAIKEMRYVSQNLLPDLLQKYGLEKALEQYCQRLSGEMSNIEFQAINISLNWDSEKELMFYRISQELINNALKHAGAKEILVQLQQREDQLFLTVEDDGMGFEEEITEKNSGLANLKHRTDYLEGTLEFSSTKNEGTSVYITCPI